MEMDEKYGVMDQITHFPTIPQSTQDLHYSMMMLGGGDSGGGILFGSDSNMGMFSTTSGFSGDSGSGGGGGLYMEIGGRWPKEENLALLDIRSRLNSQFKEAKHRGHLWEEVSRQCSQLGSAHQKTK